MELPPRALGSTATRVLLAVVAGHRTVRGIAARAGIPVTTTYDHLHRLMDLELVGFAQGTQSTFRPLVRIVNQT